MSATIEPGAVVHMNAGGPAGTCQSVDPRRSEASVFFITQHVARVCTVPLVCLTPGAKSYEALKAEAELLRGQMSAIALLLDRHSGKSAPADVVARVLHIAEGASS